jgi:hypothetical protein
MTVNTPRFDPLAAYRPLARVPPHRGTASFTLGGEAFSGAAEFLLPAGGQAVIAFQAPADLTSQDFGGELVIDGTAETGPFRLECAQIYVRKASRFEDGSTWSLISPVNGPVRMTCATRGAIRRVLALLNNFDFSCGDAVSEGGGWTRINTPLSVDGDGRDVTFRQRAERPQLLALVSAGLLHSTSIVEIAFDAHDGESDDVLLAFAADIAALCTFAAGTGVSVAMLDLMDEEGALARRIIPQPVTARYRDREVVPDFLLPQLFPNAFAEYRRMKQAHPPWGKLASYCASLEDPPYLEQKISSLITAVEFFVRNCLIEQGQPQEEVTKLEFPKLIGAARNHLGWNIPKHFTAKETVRLVRNAVVHGSALPTADSAELRLLFDKWKLFLFRRVLIRLGYAGKVTSPHKGWASTSDVGDFSQEHNDFTPADPNAPNPWRELVRKFREQQACAENKAP